MALVGALCFLVGVLVGVVCRDALSLIRQSRKEGAMRTPHINTRTLISILLAIAVVANLSCAVLLIVARASQGRIEDENKQNAITSCENANDSRAAQRALWGFILQASAANKDKTPQQRKTADEFGAWVNKLFAERDCTNLSKRYTIPPPPHLEP